MDNKSDIKRIPLSIPSEWKIIWNSFFGVSIEEAEAIEILEQWMEVAHLSNTELLFT